MLDQGLMTKVRILDTQTLALWLGLGVSSFNFELRQTRTHTRTHAPCPQRRLQDGGHARGEDVSVEQLGLSHVVIADAEMRRQEQRQRQTPAQQRQVVLQREGDDKSKP